MLSDMISNVWTKIKREHGLYRYNPSGQYFARVRFHGKLYRKKLDTDDLAVARRKLRGFRDDLERVDARKGNTSFAVALDSYAATLQGAESTLANKLFVIAKLKQTLFGCDTLPLRRLPPSQFAAWLSKHHGEKSAASYNQALSVIRSALDMAVADKIIVESPAKDLKYRKRKEPIRLTPTFEQFKQIVADIRAQKFSRDAEQSGDFVEFLGLLGVGQAEAAAIKREHVDLDASSIQLRRRKTSQTYWLPIFPQASQLVTRLCEGKKHNERLFTISQARKALAASCARLGFPSFTHRSLRRAFIVKAIEAGVDIKVIAQWQAHADQGALLLKVYSHVRPEHARRMAQLMIDEPPPNVVPISTAQA